MAPRRTVTTLPYSGPISRGASYRPQSFRQRSVGSITPGRSFNHFPEIIAAFPLALSSIVVETTDDLLDDAKARAPVGEARRDAPAPGNLRDSGQKRFFKARDGGVVRGRVEFKAKDPTRSDPYHIYPWYVEWGTVHSPAHPFLVPAIIAQRPKFLAKLGALEERL